MTSGKTDRKKEKTQITDNRNETRNNSVVIPDNKRYRNMTDINMIFQTK